MRERILKKLYSDNKYMKKLSKLTKFIFFLKKYKKIYFLSNIQEHAPLLLQIIS